MERRTRISHRSKSERTKFRGLRDQTARIKKAWCF